MEENKTKIKKDLFRVIRGLKGNSKNRGITLVALVITIVVLIILAGVIISITLGNGGIIDRAKTAKEQYQNAQDYEEMEIAKLTNEVGKYSVDGATRDVTYCTTPATSLTTSSASVTNPCVIVESYRNGTEWCRVWSDGWIEQGGYATSGNTASGEKISFNKNFLDTNYTVTTTFYNGINDGSTRTVVCVQKSIDGFNCVGSWSNKDTFGYDKYGFNWYACGY